MAIRRVPTLGLVQSSQKRCNQMSCSTCNRLEFLATHILSPLPSTIPCDQQVRGLTDQDQELTRAKLVAIVASKSPMVVLVHDKVIPYRVQTYPLTAANRRVGLHSLLYVLYIQHTSATWSPCLISKLIHNSSLALKQSFCASDNT